MDTKPAPDGLSGIQEPGRNPVEVTDGAEHRAGNPPGGHSQDRQERKGKGMKKLLIKTLKILIAAAIIWTVVYLAVRADDKEQKSDFYHSKYQGKF